MTRHYLQGCPHEDHDPVTRWRHAEHVAAILLLRIGVALLLLGILAVVVTVMP